MRVKFTDDYRYVPTEDRRVTVRFKKGYEGTVRREAGEAAVAAGKATEVGKAANLEDHDGDGKPGGDASAKGKAKA